MEHTQVDSAEDDSPASVVSGVEFPEEFDLTPGDDEIENHAPVGEGSSRDGMSEIDASDVPPVHVEVEPDSMPTRVPAVRRAFESVDSIDLREVFARKAVVMKVPPRFLKGAYCAALRMAMIEVRHGRLDRIVERQLRRERFVAFAKGRWMELWRECITNEEKTREIRSRRGRTQSDSLGKRGTRAQCLAFMGELSTARIALEGAPCAPGDEFTLRALQDERRRPREARTPLTEDVANFRPEEAPNLDRDFFLMTLRKARKGAAGGPSGMTAEHLRVLLHNENDSNLLHEMAVDVVRGEIPGPVAEAMRLGQMTALQKPAGGVRGIVVSKKGLEFC